MAFSSQKVKLSKLAYNPIVPEGLAAVIEYW
jgi:hypothetical protein